MIRKKPTKYRSAIIHLTNKKHTIGNLELGIGLFNKSSNTRRIFNSRMISIIGAYFKSNPGLLLRDICRLFMLFRSKLEYRAGKIESMRQEINKLEQKNRNLKTIIMREKDNKAKLAHAAQDHFRMIEQTFMQYPKTYSAQNRFPPEYSESLKLYMDQARSLRYDCSNQRCIGINGNKTREISEEECLEIDEARRGIYEHNGIA